MFEPGTPFADRYRIDAEVGRGTFGVVFRAFDFVESRTVALKVLNPEANADEKLKHRLRREARLTSELKGHHCVEVYDVAETADGRAYIVMELLEGQELRHALAAEKAFNPARAAEITRQILEAVGAAHEVGVVHRDLKPNNIYLCNTTDGSDSVKVLDFGIAKITGTVDGGLSESARLTTHGNVLGTPVYMSPEQTLGQVPTPATDIYSIGVMLFEMLTGRPPFDDPNPVRVMILHSSEPVPPLPEPVASSPLGFALRRALEKNPERRFQTAQEFADALTKMPTADPPPKQAVQSTEPTGPSTPAATAKPAAPPDRGTIMTGVFEAVAPPPQPEPTAKPRNNIIVIIVGAVVLLVVGAVAGMLLRG